MRARALNWIGKCTINPYELDLNKQGVMLLILGYLCTSASLSYSLQRLVVDYNLDWRINISLCTSLLLTKSLSATRLSVVNLAKYYGNNDPFLIFYGIINWEGSSVICGIHSEEFISAGFGSPALVQPRATFRF